MATILSINSLAIRLFPSNSQRYSVIFFDFSSSNLNLFKFFMIHCVSDFFLVFQMQCYLHRTMRIGQAGIHIQTNYPISFMGFLQFSKRFGKSLLFKISQVIVPYKMRQRGYWISIFWTRNEEIKHYAPRSPIDNIIYNIVHGKALYIVSQPCIKVYSSIKGACTQ